MEGQLDLAWLVMQEQKLRTKTVSRPDDQSMEVARRGEQSICDDDDNVQNEENVKTARERERERERERGCVRTISACGCSNSCSIQGYKWSA